MADNELSTITTWITGGGHLTQRASEPCAGVANTSSNKIWPFSSQFDCLMMDVLCDQFGGEFPAAIFSWSLHGRISCHHNLPLLLVQ